MCPHLEDLHNSVNQHFPDNCMMLQNPSRVKDSFKVPEQKQDKTKTNQKKVPDRPMDFNVIEYSEFINVVLDSILQLLFRKLPCIKLDIMSKKKEYLQRQILKYASLFQKHINVRRAFFHMFQPK